MIYECYLKEPLEKSIELEKLGITIRNYSEEEKDEIIQKFDEMYFAPKAKRKILKYNELEMQKDQNIIELYKFYEKLTNEERNNCFTYYRYLENNNTLRKNDLKKILNRIVKIEANEKLNEFVEENHLIFINNLIKYILYVKKNVKEEDINVVHNINDVFKDARIEDASKELAFTVKYFNKLAENALFIEYIDLDYLDFKKFNDFLKKLTKSRVRDLVVIIETFFNIHNVQENKITTDISILERLLIKHDNNYDIGKQFNLKVGLLLRENNKEFKDEDVKKLAYCYAVRSHILHGNDVDIYKLPKKYLKMTDTELEDFFVRLSIKNKREKILFMAYFFLRQYMRILLQSWIKNTEMIEFLKNN